MRQGWWRRLWAVAQLPTRHAVAARAVGACRRACVCGCGVPPALRGAARPRSRHPEGSECQPNARTRARRWRASRRRAPCLRTTPRPASAPRREDESHHGGGREDEREEGTEREGGEREK
eukprot:4100638-Prymnesium_polylepis.1